MIIDIHHHVGGYKPPIDVRTRTRLKISRIDPDDQYRSLIKQMDKNGIDITGIMGPYDHDQMKKYSNRFFGISMFENYPKPNIEKIEYDVTTLGLKALKMLPDLSGPPGYAGERKRGPFDPKDKIMDPVYKKAIDLDIPTWWHAVESLRDVIIKYPELKVVIAHLGDKAGDPIELCKTYPNVYIEASAITATMMWKAMPPMPYNGPPEMKMVHTLNRNWAMMNSDNLEGTKKPYMSKDERMNQAWQKVRKEHNEIIKSCALQCPNKFMFGSDGPFACRPEITLELYKETLAEEKEILQKVLAENAIKLFKI